MQIRRGLLLGLSLLLCSAITGCLSSFPNADTARVSPLQVRAMESREFEGHDTKSALKTVLNVLQDEGFLVNYGNVELGILHASKTIGETIDQRLSNFGNNALPFGSTLQTEATVNVSEFGERIKIRINFQQKILSPNNSYFGSSSILAAGPVTDAKSYQEFFAKVERGLFIQKQGL